MINIYMIVFDVEGKSELKRFFIHACNLEDAERFALKKLEELKNEYGTNITLKRIEKTMKQTKYTDDRYIYYVSALLGENQYAVCKKTIGSKSVGNHKYKSRTNKVVSTAKEAQEYLNKLAKDKKWDVYE